MKHLGFAFESPTPRHDKSFGKLRKTFCARLELLHTMIASQYRHDVFSWDYRGPSRCCGVFLKLERAFVCKGFTWPESYLIRLQRTTESPDPQFYVMVIRITSRRITPTKQETKSVKKVMQRTSKTSAR